MAFLTRARLAAAVLLPLALAGCGHVGKPTNVRLTARECMARAMYFESNRSSDDGMLAVGTVVMNRVESGRYPRSVCGVVGQPRQFAPGVLTRPMTDSGKPRAFRMADAVLRGARNPRVGSKSMFFHTAGYKFPYRNMHYVAIAGGNAFYEKRRPGPGIMIASQESIASAERVRMASVEPETPVAVVREPVRIERRQARPAPVEERRIQVADARPLPPYEAPRRRAEPRPERTHPRDEIVRYDGYAEPLSQAGMRETYGEPRRVASNEYDNPREPRRIEVEEPVLAAAAPPRPAVRSAPRSIEDLIAEGGR
ncbi:cell wall hydrolase [Methylopila turkensis]|nr:cell wall hydrolase [Methylopila turkensis]